MEQQQTEYTLWRDFMQIAGELEPSRARAHFLTEAHRDDTWPEKRRLEQPVDASGQPGVYAFAKRSGSDFRLLYVGSSTVTIGSRVWQPQSLAAFEESDVLFTYPCDPRAAVVLEMLLLASEPKPVYNTKQPGSKA